jgi:hypothetical protein
MGFWLRMILGGCCAAIIGVVWFFNGLRGEDPDGIVTGGLWKGPLLFLAGAAGAFMGLRALREGRDQSGEGRGSAGSGS